MQNNCFSKLFAYKYRKMLRLLFKKCYCDVTSGTCAFRQNKIMQFLLVEAQNCFGPDTVYPVTPLCITLNNARLTSFKFCSSYPRPVRPQNAGVGGGISGNRFFIAN